MFRRRIYRSLLFALISSFQHTASGGQLVCVEMTGQALSQGMSAAWTGMSAGKTLLSTLVQLRSYPHGLKGERVFKMAR